MRGVNVAPQVAQIGAYGAIHRTGRDELRNNYRDELGAHLAPTFPA